MSDFLHSEKTFSPIGEKTPSLQKTAAFTAEMSSGMQAEARDYMRLRDFGHNSEYSISQLPGACSQPASCGSSVEYVVSSLD